MHSEPEQNTVYMEEIVFSDTTYLLYYVVVHIRSVSLQ